jgi:hypothetical protein
MNLKVMDKQILLQHIDIEFMNLMEIQLEQLILLRLV